MKALVFNQQCRAGLLKQEIIMTTFVEFILGDGKLVSDGNSSHRNPTGVSSKDG